MFLFLDEDRKVIEHTLVHHKCHTPVRLVDFQFRRGEEYGNELNDRIMHSHGRGPKMVFVGNGKNEANAVLVAWLICDVLPKVLT